MRVACLVSNIGLLATVGTWISAVATEDVLEDGMTLVQKMSAKGVASADQERAQFGKAFVAHYTKIGTKLGLDFLQKVNKTVHTKGVKLQTLSTADTKQVASRIRTGLHSFLDYVQEHGLLKTIDDIHDSFKSFHEIESFHEKTNRTPAAPAGAATTTTTSMKPPKGGWSKLSTPWKWALIWLVPLASGFYKDCFVAENLDSELIQKQQAELTLHSVMNDVEYLLDHSEQDNERKKEIEEVARARSTCLYSSLVGLKYEMQKFVPDAKPPFHKDAVLTWEEQQYHHPHYFAWIGLLVSILASFNQLFFHENFDAWMGMFIGGYFGGLFGNLWGFVHEGRKKVEFPPLTTPEEKNIIIGEAFRSALDRVWILETAMTLALAEIGGWLGRHSNHGENAPEPLYLTKAQEEAKRAWWEEQDAKN